MELLFDLFIRRLVIRMFGINARYFFFKMIGKQKTYDELSGVSTKSEIQQDVINAITGIAVFCSIMACIAYTYDNLL